MTRRKPAKIENITNVSQKSKFMNYIKIYVKNDYYSKEHQEQDSTNVI